MLTKVEGMIVEVGSEDPPQIYEDFDSLVMAWVSLHQLYGVPVSDEEKEALIDNYSDDKLSSDPLLNSQSDEEADAENETQ